MLPHSRLICLAFPCRAQDARAATGLQVPLLLSHFWVKCRLGEQIHSRPMVPLLSPPLPVSRQGSSGHMWDPATQSCPALFHPSREMHSAQPRTVAICKDGQSQAQH